MAEESRKPLRFTTQSSITTRLVLSTLTGRSIQITSIRPNSPSSPGLAPHEISFLRLLEAVTNGSQIDISMTGTTLRYKPGLITGCSPGSGAVSGVIRHETPAACERGVSYFLLPLCLLAPFSKAPFNILFTGPGTITSATPAGDMSVDSVRTAILPLYAHFGITNNLELRINRRSNPGATGRGGAGEVQLVFGTQVRLPKTLHLLNPGKVKRIRGVAYTTGVSGSNNARMIEAARGVLNALSGDTYIYSDVSSAPFVASADRSQPGWKTKTGLGFGLSLIAESSTGVVYSADVASPVGGGEVPEDIGARCAWQLLDVVAMGGVVPLSAAPTVLVLMAMGSEDVGRVQLGKGVVGSEEIVGLARDLEMFGAAQWGVREAKEGGGDEVVVSVVGKGVGNVGRKVA